ncbi:hypothetical protein HF086_007140 [Spodoptera exigua]|uniref:Uncharacterized protein n=1 Tax=Spodoptera exigua TaxID=7107 RepID=A0A922MGI2_SPOEX|nr:hypothetical protein HF086_007140 [Spodoptera exigua]
MGLEKRTIKIILIVAAVVLVIGAIIGLLLGLLLPQRYVELEVWPRSEEYNWEQPLIQVRGNDPGSWHIWYQRLNDFLRVYETSIPEDPPRAPCSVHNRRDQHLRSDACDMAMRLWHPCTADDFYGYAMGKPYYSGSKIHYWVPEPYNMTMPMSIPPDMPQHIREAMYIPAEYPPGFPLSRLHTADRIPYSARNMPDQVPGPLIAVHFENPRRGVVINVECRIWTRDIIYDPKSRYGRARFELFVE